MESSSRQPLSSEQLRTDALHHLNSDDVYWSDQHVHTDSDSTTSLQHSTSPSATLRYPNRSFSPVGSDKGSEARTSLDHTQADSALYTQLELLHQECQEKEALINKLSEQLADWEELHAQIQEKDRLNSQYVEALRAAESTIAYLTACSLDSQSGFGSHTGSGSLGSDISLHSRCMELQKALQQKEELNNQLIELLKMTEKAISSAENQEKNPEISALCRRIEGALQQLHTSSKEEGTTGVPRGSEESVHELQRHADSLQEALWEQNRLNAELQEQLRAANAAAQHGYSSDGAAPGESLKENEPKEHCGSVRGPANTNLNPEVIEVLMNCFSAAESAVASLAAHCTNSGSITAGRSQISSDLQMNLDKLQRALQDREQLGEPTPQTTKPNNLSTASTGTKGQELHQHLCLLYEVFIDCSQKISELQASLQEERGHRMEREAHRAVQDGKGLPPGVQAELETLHKALREKKKACKSLEEKLATALTNTSSPEVAKKGNVLSSCLFFCAAIQTIL